MKEIKSIFLMVFGDSPRLRVLDFLIIHRQFDYSMKDIAKYSNIGYATLKLFWRKLEKFKIIKMTRTVGKAKMYTLNTKDTKVKEFMRLYWATVESETKNKFKKEKMIAAKNLL